MQPEAFKCISTTDKRLDKKNLYQHSAQIIMAECAHETPYDNPDLNGKYKSTVSHISNFSKHSIDFTATDRKKNPESLRITIEF